MTYVAQVDAGACSAHGDCEDIAPEIFRLEDIAIVHGSGPDELMLAAAEACPSTAIRLIDRDTGAQVYP
ncbi:MAG TPA: ferredoxin [Solirubrobacteraceae bacterium]|nr:ferredoxin [Solirubrobacteraceae bacterium]